MASPLSLSQREAGHIPFPALLPGHLPTLQDPSKSHPTTTSLEGLQIYRFASGWRRRRIPWGIQSRTLKVLYGSEPWSHHCEIHPGMNVCGAELPGTTCSPWHGTLGAPTATQPVPSAHGDVQKQCQTFFIAWHWSILPWIQRTPNGNRCQAVWMNDKYQQLTPTS